MERNTTLSLGLFLAEEIVKTEQLLLLGKEKPSLHFTTGIYSCHFCFAKYAKHHVEHV